MQVAVSLTGERVGVIDTWMHFPMSIDREGRPVTSACTPVLIDGSFGTILFFF
jgi:hypothetical protein